MADESVKGVTDKPLIGIIIGVAFTALVIGITFFAAGKGWKAGTKTT